MPKKFGSEKEKTYKSKLFITNLHAFCVKKIMDSAFFFQHLKMQVNPKLQQILSALVVISHFEVVLYENIVSINSTIHGATYGLHGEKISKIT